MAVQVKRKAGYSGSANRKIVQANQDLGFKGIGEMQGTTRIIFDAIPLAATTTNTTVTLFENCKTRQFPLTNLSENKLQVGESITVQRISLYVIQCTTGTTNLVGISPLAYFASLSRIYGGWLSFSIAQDQVIKKMPLASMYAPFNPSSQFIGYYQTQPLATDPLTSYLMPHDVYKMETNLVIPPQIEFVANVTLPPLTMPSGFDAYLAMKIEGLGSLFAPKANY